MIVDETSMVSLSLMARLVEAVRPDARLVLVGDPGQLTSIEAGAVLGDIVGPAARAAMRRARPRSGEGGAADRRDAIGTDRRAERVHRFGGGSRARRGDPRGDADARARRRSPRRRRT